MSISGMLFGFYLGAQTYINSEFYLEDPSSFVDMAAFAFLDVITWLAVIW